MEHGIICKSQEALIAACVENDLKPDDVYVICSPQDLNFALKDTRGKELTLHLGSDWQLSGIKQDDFASRYNEGEQINDG